MAKTYEYRVFRELICPPFLARYVHACPWPIDLEVLQACARLFEGEHDFLSFAATDPDLASRTRIAGQELDLEPEDSCNAGHDASTTSSGATEFVAKQGAVRTIFSSTWERRESENGEILIYRVRGNGFLHHMVRNLVGTMIDVGRGYRKLEEIPQILAARTRAAAGPTAPAQGLFLHSVEYSEEFLSGIE